MEIIKNFQPLYFSLYNNYQGIEGLKSKFKESLKLYEKMTSFQQNRPNCEEILNGKNSWALNEKEFEIDDELKNLILKLDNEKQFVFYILKSKFNI